MIRSTPVTFGQTVAERRVASVVATEATYPPETHICAHDHDFPSLLWALSGRLVEVVERKSTDCVPGSVMFLPAGASHSNFTGSVGARVLVVELLPEFARNVAEGTALLDRPFLTARSLPAALAVVLAHALEDSDGLGFSIGIEELVLHLTASLAQEAAPGPVTPVWLRRVRDEIHESPTGQWTLSSLARDAGVHPGYLARCFRAAFKCSITEYLHARRMGLAVQFLEGTDLEIGRIGLDLGYYDHAHFTRAFRRVLGVSPSAYRTVSRPRPGTDPNHPEVPGQRPSNSLRLQ